MVLGLSFDILERINKKKLRFFLISMFYNKIWYGIIECNFYYLIIKIDFYFVKVKYEVKVI